MRRGTNNEILDTKKTAPGWRMLDKYAVRCAAEPPSARSFRCRVIKNNHIALAGGVVEALERTHRNRRGTQRLSGSA